MTDIQMADLQKVQPSVFIAKIKYLMVEFQNRSNYTRCGEYRSKKDSAIRQIG